MLAERQNAAAPALIRGFAARRGGNGPVRAAAENLQKKKTEPKYNQDSILKCLDLSYKMFRKMLRGTGTRGP